MGPREGTPSSQTGIGKETPQLAANFRASGVVVSTLVGLDAVLHQPLAPSGRPGRLQVRCYPKSKKTTLRDLPYPSCFRLVVHWYGVGGMDTVLVPRPGAVLYLQPSCSVLNLNLEYPHQTTTTYLVLPSY